jgi:hypothetical protein
LLNERRSFSVFDLVGMRLRVCLKSGLRTEVDAVEGFCKRANGANAAQMAAQMALAGNER